VSIEPPTRPSGHKDYDEADRAAVRRHNVELLTKLNDAAATWAMELLQQPKPQEPAEAEKTGATFDRVLRAIRRTVLLIDKLISPPKEPAADPGPRREPDQRTYTTDTHRDRLDRLETVETIEAEADAIEDEYAHWTEERLLAAVIEDLGLGPLDRRGKPFTLDTASLHFEFPSPPNGENPFLPIKPDEPPKPDTS
jgi:hypothetical protein